MHESVKEIIRLPKDEFNKRMAGAMHQLGKTVTSGLFWSQVSMIRFRYEKYCRFVENRNKGLKKYY